MTTLRCTAKLSKAMKARPVSSPSPATNRLGEWTANLVRVSRIQLVIAVSEPTRFGLVVDAAPYADIPLRLQQQLFKALLFIGVPADMAATEAETMISIEIAATNSKSVLGTLNQFAFEVECDIHHGVARSGAELTERLSDRIVCNPKDIGHPADRVRECFGLPALDRRWNLPAAISPANALVH